MFPSKELTSRQRPLGLLEFRHISTKIHRGPLANRFLTLNINYTLKIRH
jgi:hypothetical protein